MTHYQIDMFSVLLLAVVVGLALLLAQNVSPSLPLVFLGMRSQPLPLSAWLLLSLAAGVLSSIFMAALFQFSNYLAQQQWRRDLGRDRRSRGFSEGASSSYPPPPPPHSPEVEAAYKVDPSDRYPKTVIQEPQGFVQSYGATASNLKDAAAGPAVGVGIDDDWNEPTRRVGAGSDEDWGDEGEKPGLDRDGEGRNQRDYQVDRQPKTQSWSGSIYSYGYRDPSGSGVGKTESVYDADYRVITPPEATPIRQDDWEKPKDQDEDDEDWGLDEDEPNDEKRRNSL